MFRKLGVRYLLLILCLFGSSAMAIDFVVDDKPNEKIVRGYLLQGNEVVGGYPIFQADGGWIFSTMEILNATGPQRSIPSPQVWLNRIESGKWAMGQSVMVTLYADDASRGWSGDPCSGEKIVKINQIRGNLDRCAIAELVNLSIDGKPTDVIAISFIETNDRGRYYSTTLYANLEHFGLTQAIVTSKDNEFNKQLAAWMKTMLTAVVKAASYDKPSDAFAHVPSLSSSLVAR